MSKFERRRRQILVLCGAGFALVFGLSAYKDYGISWTALFWAVFPNVLLWGTLYALSYGDSLDRNRR